MSERLRILNLIESGEVTPEEGARMLENLPKGNEPKAGVNEEMQILEKIESGEISPDEGIQLLQGSIGSVIDQDDPAEFLKRDEKTKQGTPPIISQEELDKWKRWWMYPMYIGIGITVLAAYWMFSAFQDSSYGFWFFCSWLPMLLGIVLIALAWNSQSGTWLHVRVRSKSQRVSISMPIPMRLTAWGLRTFGHFIPHLEDTSLDEIILALDSTAKDGNPFYVQVDEGKNGEKVEVFIG